MEFIISELLQLGDVYHLPDDEDAEPGSKGHLCLTTPSCFASLSKWLLSIPWVHLPAVIWRETEF